MQVRLTKEMIDQVFVEHKDNRIEGMLELFKLVIPNWEGVSQVKHFPQVNRKTADYILEKMTEDCPNERVSLAMVWMNNGFGCSKQNVPEWVVDVEIDKIQYKKEE